MARFARSLPALCLLPATVLGAATLLVSHYSGHMYTLALSDAGNLTIASEVASGARQPSWITLDSAGKTLYVTDEWEYGGGTPADFEIGDGGALTLKSQARTPGGELHSTLYGGPDGKTYLAMAEYDASTIITMQVPLSSGSSVLQKMKFTMAKTGPVPSRQDAPHPHSTYTDPTGRFLLSNDLGADLIRIFAIDADTGNLVACTAQPTAPGDGPRHGAFWTPGQTGGVPAASTSGTPGTMLYTVNELGNSVTSWAVSYPANTTGCLGLTKRATISNLGPGKAAPAGTKSAEVHVYGAFAYAANRNDQSFGTRRDSIAAYAIDPATGDITFLELTDAYSYFPRTFAVNAAGTMVAMGGQTSSNVAVIARNTTTGQLGPLVASLNVGTPGTVNNEDGLSAVVWNE